RKLVVLSRELVQIYINGYTFYEEFGFFSGEIPTKAECWQLWITNQQLEIYDASASNYSCKQRIKLVFIVCTCLRDWYKKKEQLVFHW
ncbi:MAG: hypothetical protein ACRC6H_06995, partial [Culicoidibacterales bacterium]